MIRQHDMTRKCRFCFAMIPGGKDKKIMEIHEQCCKGVYRGVA